ncbi:MAG: hypothetical protein JJU21_01480 [Salinarimonas sp.]|nr:hypothetical protein [Salinarimonas sp.]
MAGPIYDGFVPGRFPIDAYGNGGFRFAEMSHKGSILALPSGISKWDVDDAGALDEAAFAQVFAEAQEIELLLIGTGRNIVPLPEPLAWRLRDPGMRIDVMQTGAAARTFNILLAEDRRVAAALIAVP